MQALVVKHTYPGLGVFAQVQDTRSKDLSNHCGCDRVICIEEIQASLFAANCVVPGIQALIPNLVHSYHDMEDSFLTDFWMKEYQYGISNQIHSFKIPNGLVGLKYSQVVLEIFGSYSTMIFGLVTSNSGFNQNPIRIGIDKNYRVKNDDLALCISEGGDETIIRIGIHYKTINARIADMQRIELEEEIEFTLTSGLAHSPMGPMMYEEVSFEQESPLGSIPTGMHSHIILCGNLNTRLIRHFVKALRSRQNLCDSHRGNFPIVCILENIPNVEEIGIWTDILSYGGVFVCQGSSIKKTTLERARISKCSHIVMFADKAPKTKDAITVFLVKMIQQEWPHVKFLVEMVEGSNVKFFNGKNITWDTVLKK